MNHSPASIMTYYIINELSKMTDPSDGDTWPLYDSFMPDGPQVEADCGAVYDMFGALDNRYMSGKVIEHQGVRLEIRSSDKNIGYAKIEDIALALDAVKLETFSIEGSNYLLQNISSMSLIESGVEPGTKRRYHFAVGYLLTIKEN